MKTALGGLLVVVLVTGDAPPGRYSVADGVVLDTVTQLAWQQRDDGAEHRFSAAVDLCANNAAALPGQGWRVPSINELLSIVDESTHDPALDRSAFRGADNVCYWSASIMHQGQRRVVNFEDGRSDGMSENLTCRVRCVR